MRGEIENWVVSAILREVEPRAALVQMCDVFGRHFEAACVAVPKTARSVAAVVASTSAETGATKLAFSIASNASFEEIESKAQELGVTWIATEAIGGLDEQPLGTLVLLGRSELRASDDALKRAARLCGVVLDRYSGESTLARVAHRLNNALASVMANLDLVSAACDGEGMPSRPPPPSDGSSGEPSSRRELGRAASEAVKSARRAAALIHDLVENPEG